MGLGTEGKSRRERRKPRRALKFLGGKKESKLKPIVGSYRYLLRKIDRGVVKQMAHDFRTTEEDVWASVRALYHAASQPIISPSDRNWFYEKPLSEKREFDIEEVDNILFNLAVKGISFKDKVKIVKEKVKGYSEVLFELSNEGEVVIKYRYNPDNDTLAYILGSKVHEFGHMYQNLRVLDAFLKQEGGDLEKAFKRYKKIDSPDYGKMHESTPEMNELKPFREASAESYVHFLLGQEQTARELREALGLSAAEMKKAAKLNRIVSTKSLAVYGLSALLEASGVRGQEIRTAMKRWYPERRYTRPEWYTRAHNWVKEDIHCALVYVLPALLTKVMLRLPRDKLAGILSSGKYMTIDEFRREFIG
jgi:hypothetical protein